jgi:1-acyl-sn-glycerol-3-phosphate acyltransferase
VGEVVAIFPEGEIWRRQEPPIGEFAPGVIYLQRRTEASILPVAVWISQRTWPRRRYLVQFGRRIQVPEDLDLETGAAWLREQVLELYEVAKREGQV